jgi:hypothetical protein
MYDLRSYEDPNGVNYTTAYTYNPMDEVKTATQGNQTRTYVRDTLRRTSGNNNGNLPGQTVTHNGPNFNSPLTFTPSYGYDTLNRLTSASESGNSSQAFGYDRYGNMWQSGSTGTLPGNVMPTSSSGYNSATNQLTTASYDAAGNQKSYSTHSSTYDPENRQSPVYNKADGPTFTYGYDGIGTRVSKTAAGVTTQYVHDTFGNLAAEYSTAGPQDVQCGTCYLSLDHLGSTRLVTDRSANVIARHDYLPFGQEIPGGDAGRTSQWTPRTT